jgi:hypothetical protein
MGVKPLSPDDLKSKKTQLKTGELRQVSKIWSLATLIEVHPHSKRKP